jgi:hypothetical protein
MTQRTRIVTFVSIALLAGVLAMSYAVRAKRLADLEAVTASGVVSDDAALKVVGAGPHVLLRSTRLGEGYGHLVAVPRDSPSGPRYQTALECDRLDMAGGAGVCLYAQRGMQTSYQAILFDSSYQPVHTLTLSGIPSRVRVSPDGALAGITVFVSGHSYSSGQFSTLTTLVDMRRGTTIADLESFEIVMNDQPFKKSDFNFWGVTFARDSNTFYATLATGDALYLIRGDARSRRGVVIGQGVECPALSPDNNRIAFKKRMNIDGRLIWRLAVLDLATGGQELITGETRSVDDQVQWLDNDRLLYSVPDEQQGRSGTSIWVASTTGAASSLWADGAYSPSVVTP